MDERANIEENVCPFFQNGRLVNAITLGVLGIWSIGSDLILYWLLVVGLFGAIHITQILLL